MLNKIYETLKLFIKQNKFFCIALIIILFLTFVHLPYQVEMPGGLINLNDRIKINDKDVTFSGSFNMAYVSVAKGSIPYILVGLLNPDWEVVKYSDVTYENESIEESYERNRVYLEQSKNSALLSAMKEANIPYEVTKVENRVVYLTEDAQTDIKIGDNIVSVNDTTVNNVEEISTVINKCKAGDKIKLKAINNGEEHERYAILYEKAGKILAGLTALTITDFESDINVEFSTRSSESGPSGGMMMSLMAYAAFTNQDLTHGKKIVGTGTITEDGKVGEIGGIKYKISGAVKQKADIFFAPKENYEEAIKVKKDKKYDIEIVCVETLRDVIDYLEALNE